MNKQKTVYLKDLLKKYKESGLKYKLPVILGEDEQGKPQFADFVKLEHILMTGTTGSGKSIFEHSIISTLTSLYSPDELRLFLVDMKRVDLPSYNGSPYLLAPVVVDYNKFYASLDWLMQEKDRRFRISESSLKESPDIVAIIDTFSDLHYENPIKFQMYMNQLMHRAAEVKIYITMSDSRSGDTEMYTPLICGLFPTKICFNVSAAEYSKGFIGTEGAEKLLGRGDMLFLPPYLKKPVRIQGPWISEEEIETLVKDKKKEYNISSKRLK